MQRTLGVIALALIAVVLSPVGSADAVTPTACKIQTLDERPGEMLVFAEAGPFLRSGTSVTTGCELRLGGAGGTVVGNIARSAPGPVGILATDDILFNLPFGDIWACTYTVANTGRITHFCEFAFRH